MIRDHDMELQSLLQRLPQAQPDGIRAARVRARCHKALARRQPAASAPHRSRALESVLLGAFSLAYLGAVAIFALKSHGVL